MSLTKPTGPLADYRGLVTSDTSNLKPLTEEETRLFIMVRTSPENKIASVWNEVLGEGGISQVFNRRLGNIPLSVIKPSVRLFCTALCDRPGLAVLWAYTLALMATESFEVDIGTFSQIEYFGWGLPSPEFLEAQWLAQKAEDHTNNLDRYDFWPKYEK